MAITKETIRDKVEIVTEYKHIQIRLADIIKEDGTQISHAYRRYTLSAGSVDKDDNFVDTDISGEDSEIQSICNTVWTQAVKDLLKAKLIADKSGLGV